MLADYRDSKFKIRCALYLWIKSNQRGVIGTDRALEGVRCHSLFFLFCQGVPPMKSICQAMLLAVEMGMFFAVLAILHHVGLIGF